MGKEQELLEAARSGNLSVVERILSQRAKRTGPLASLRRGPGANTQDQSGYTSLHHSALNGHKDIVSLLLAHEASTNVVDHKGSTPLHLAAWTGNTEIVKLLLVHGSSQPNVNLANHDRETALHSAAQYGHTEVVALLLQNTADPSVRNLKDESPLDLAAQYGRLETVELLVKAHPELLHDNAQRHSPLHLAARNGHRQVCKVLLDAGFEVNYLTDNGSALHEAALYGKVEVVKLLLEYGVDANLENCQRRTVFDLLEDLNTAIAKQIWRIIKDHSTLVSTDDDITESPSSISPPPGFLSSGPYANVLVPDRYGLSPPRQMSSPVSDISFYEVPAPMKSVNPNQRTTSDFFHTTTPSHSRDSSFEHTSPCSRSPSLYEAPPPPREVEPPSVVAPSFQSPYDARLATLRSSRSSDSEAILYEIPPPPPPSSSTPGKRFSDPLQQGATYQNVVPIKTGEKDSRLEQRAATTTWSGAGSYIPMAPLQCLKPQDDVETESVEDDSELEYKNKKRNSRDIETLTEEQLFATIDDDSGEVQLILGKENKSVSTDIEEIIADDPYAGLCRGSTSQLENSRENLKIPLKSSTCDTKPPVARRTRNIYENVNIEMESSGRNKVVLQNSTDGNGDRRSGSLSVMSPFDENAEWAAIADIMASFGSGITRESVFAREVEPTFANALSSEPVPDFQTSKDNREGFATVEQWLSSIGLPEYENLLIINGFDDIHFMGCPIIEEQDLKDIGISNADHRQKLVMSAQKLPSVKPIGKGENKAGIPKSVDQWLLSLHLEEYQETFRKNGFTDIGRVLKLWEVELNTVLEINKIGHRKRILASLGEKSPDRFFSYEDFDLSKLNLRLSELGIDNDAFPTVEGDGKHNDYAVINTKKLISSSTSVTPNHKPTDFSKETLRIRPPTQLMSEPGTEEESPDRTVGVPAVMTAQWRHEPEALINNCCNYSAKYLGSTLVKELKGMESTRKSIQKLKASTREIGKIPNVILSISYTGVKFIDAQTQQLVCEHEIRNIHCACQDADDLNHFAYITKEHQTRNHYCHVFCAQTMDLATEIILTLGQAFEVAYQLALREKAGKPNQHGTVQTAVNTSSSQKMDRHAITVNSGQLAQKAVVGGDSALEMLLKERTKL